MVQVDAADAVRRLQHDETDGFEQLVAAYQARAMRVAYGITRDWHLAEDVVADSFLALYQARSRLDPDRSPEAWLARVVANRAVSAVRRRTALTRALMALVKQERRPADPQEVAIGNLDAVAVRQVMAHCSPKDRTVLVLRYYLDLAPSEISRQLGWPEGTVKTRLHRARERFRTALGAEIPDEALSGAPAEEGGSIGR